MAPDTCQVALKQIEDHAEAASREQLVAMPAVLQGARLAHFLRSF
jgi:hypothetical protein